MKTTTTLVCLTVLLLVVGRSNAATVNPFTDLANGGSTNFMILSLGGCNSGVTACDAGKTNVSMQNGSQIFGNIGVAPNGDVAIGNNSTVYGIGYVDQGANINTGTGSTFTGGTTVNGATNTMLDAAAAAAAKAYVDAQAGSNIANYNLVTVAGGSINNPSSQVTITGLANKTNVINLSNLVLSSDIHDLILSGPSTAKFIINISGNFAVTNGSDITLAGGLIASNVIYNVIGTNGGTGSSTGAVCFSSTAQSGSCLTNATGTPTTFVSGIVLAPLRDITLNGAVVDGEVISGNLNITVDDSKLVPEPGTLIGFATGLAGLGIRWGRKRFRSR